MQPPSDQRFYRGADRIVGGVCSGLAQGLHVDTIWVRLAFVALAFAQGVGVIVYVILWVIMPERGQDRPAGRTAFDSMADDVRRAWADLRSLFGGRPPASPSTSPTAAAAPSPVAIDPTTPAPPPTTPGVGPAPAATHNQSLVLGVILVLVGLAFLGSNSGFVNWSVIWPVALIALGVVLLALNLQRRS